MDWSIPVDGVAGRSILGTTHLPEASTQGVVLLGHGFKGYKDYGFIPWLSQHLCDAGCVVHRFNFSGSGMEHGHGRIDPDAFHGDTWNRQVEDVLALMGAIASDRLPGGPGPVLLMGHSRGGVTSLLSSGRHAGDDVMSSLRGVATLAAPSGCLSMTPEEQAELLSTGGLDSPSNRTGQVLSVGRGFLQEQLDDPEGHDVLTQARRIRVPVSVIHGMEDDAVPAGAARELCSALGDGATLHLLEGGNHVFNVSNPFPLDEEPSPQLREVGSITARFASELFSC